MVITSNICYIVGALPLDSRLAPAPQLGDLLIAADGGYTNLKALNIRPDLVVGDFDSSPIPTDHPNVQSLPSIKDETDVGYALGEGLSRGYRNFIILGGLGGGLDHTMANLQLLHNMQKQGAFAILVGDTQCATVITETALSFSFAIKGRISIFAMGGEATGVTLRGLKYPLMDEPLSPQFPLGVSNELIGLPATISVKNGSLLAIWDYNGDLDGLTSQFF